MIQLKEYIERSSVPEPNSGCWIWTLLGDVGGYGRGKFQGRRSLAHRLSWEAHNGPVQPGLSVCHKCDTPLCVNPEHLFVATHAENMSDMRKKGRTNPPVGTRAHLSKLSDEVVRHILASDLSGADLGRLLGVSRTTVSKIRQRKTWAHVAIAQMAEMQAGA